MRWALTLLLALLAGIAALYGLTDGFTVLTAESARRQEVALAPRDLQDARIIDGQGRVSSLRSELQADGRVAIVNFFYTRCISLCLAQGYVTQRLQAAIKAAGLDSHVRLLSISFDPRDRGPDLNRYASGMHADPAVWQFRAFEQPRQGAALLKQFGIIVVPAVLGDFEHNAALHVVTSDGRLARIVDIDEPGLALQVAKALSASRTASRLRDMRELRGLAAVGGSRKEEAQ
ncbi:SCO family protein [Pusillimonas noertemannii]|uniref:SCO family protein n=1 Tax=Pusillimonas noertemannii TaxID=305977 RepID=UPI0003008F00|nr:SCO family protein [Pusillimonas noertemannii]